MTDSKQLKPLTEQVLICEIVTQTKFAERAARQLAEASDPIEVWGSIQAILVAVGNVSKTLWPTKKRYLARGEHLRELLGVDCRNLLPDRTFRNHLEHYDERIEGWLETNHTAVYNDSRIDPLPPTPLSPTQFFHRSYNPTSQRLTFRDETIDLAEVLAEVAEIRRRCRPFALP